MTVKAETKQPLQISLDLAPPKPPSAVTNILGPGPKIQIELARRAWRTARAWARAKPVLTALLSLVFLAFATSRDSSDGGPQNDQLIAEHASQTTMPEPRVRQMPHPAKNIDANASGAPHTHYDAIEEVPLAGLSLSDYTPAPNVNPAPHDATVTKSAAPGSRWLRAQDAEHFALVVAVENSLDRIEQTFYSHPRLALKALDFEPLRPRYRLVYNVYSNADAAHANLRNLPASLSNDQQTSVVGVAKLQALKQLAAQTARSTTKPRLAEARQVQSTTR